MMADANINRPTSGGSDQIDFSKLRIVIRNNWVWILLILVVCNTASYLYIRYTKNVYESESLLKLEIKEDASMFGIKSMAEEPHMNLLSGEIEIIRSRMFLNRVLDEVGFEIGFFSIGHLLNEELFRNAPATVTYFNKDHALYNQRILFREITPNTFELSTDGGLKSQGTYGKLTSLGELQVILNRNDDFRKSDELGYFFIVYTRDVLLNDILDHLSAEPVNFNANTIRVSFRDYNPYKAQYVLNKIDTIYLEYSNEQKNLANKQKIEWINRELSNIEDKMANFEDYFEDFTLRNKTHDLDEDLKQTIAALTRIDSQLYEYETRIKEVEHLIEGLTTGAPVFTFGLRRSIPERLSQQLDALLELQQEQDRLKLSYKEVTFAYRQKEQDIRALQEKTRAQLEEVRDRWRRETGNLQQRKAALEREFMTIPDKNTQYSKNQRFYKLYEEFYLTLMQSKSEFEIAQAGTTPDFKILSSATLPSRPIFPNKYIITGIGIVSGFVLIVFFVATSYLLNNKINNLYELERYDLPPVLGAIPSSGSLTDGHLHVVHQPRSMVSEAIRTLRTNLEFISSGSDKKIIAISSTVSGEGKSFLAMNLGGVIAMSDKRTLLVDLDMRKSGMQRPFKSHHPTKGISTILIGKDTCNDCIVSGDVPNLDYLPAGPQPPNPSELLMRPGFKDMLNELRQVYDVIILDTPPVGLVTDGIMAMKQADVSIYVFRANYSRGDFVRNLQRIVNIHKFTNITTLLNAVATPGKAYGYGYYEDDSKSEKLKTFLKKKSA